MGVRNLLHKPIFSSICSSKLPISQSYCHSRTLPESQSPYHPTALQYKDVSQHFPFTSAFHSKSYAKVPTEQPQVFLLGAEVTKPDQALPFQMIHAQDFVRDFAVGPVFEKSRNFGSINNAILGDPPGTGLSFLKVGSCSSKSFKGVPPLDLICNDGGRHWRIPIEEEPVTSKAKQDVSSRMFSPTVSPAEEFQWELIWDINLPKRRTWECLGSNNPYTEKPFLSEMVQENVHKSWLLAMQNLNLVDQFIIPPTMTVISNEQLVLNLGYLAIGIASEIFPFVETENRFRVKVSS